MKISTSVVQDSPVFFDKKKTIQKLEAVISAEAKSGAQLIVFPESFIPGYPRGFSFGTVVGSRTEEGRDLYAKYHENSVDIQSNDLINIEKLAKSLNVYVVIGVTEKEGHTGSLYCSMMYISPKSGLLGVHRKIKPTGQERVIWHESDGRSLVTCCTDIGKIGGLICWENYMPLARMSMYRRGVELYIAPTADARDNWTATMKHIALEGRCFVLSSNQYFTKSMYPEEFQSMITLNEEEICRGGSMIVSPMGEVLAGPLFGSAGVIRAELDLDLIVKSKLDFDVIGHYSRDDIFSFEAKGQPDIQSE